MKTNVLGLLLLFAMCAPRTKEMPMSISNQPASNATAASLIVNGQINGRNTTWAWLQTGPGGVPWKFQLQDYATGNGPIWNVGALTPIASLTGYDEVFVYIINVGGTALLARFGWSAENLSGAPGPGADAIADDLGADSGSYPSQSASSIIAGGLDAQGNGTSILRLPTLPVEYGPILGSKCFRLQVKGPMLFVGLSTLGAPNAGQIALVQIVPRSLGVPKS